MIEFKEQEDKLEVTFPSQLDALACEQFQDELCYKIREVKKPVVFDMANVEFVSSVFLTICCIAHKDAGHENFAITHVQPMIYRVFKTAGLDGKLIMH